MGGNVLPNLRSDDVKEGCDVCCVEIEVRGLIGKTSKDSLYIKELESSVSNTSSRHNGGMSRKRYDNKVNFGEKGGMAICINNYCRDFLGD